MIVGVPTETFPGERRVATIPAVVPALTKAGLEVLLEPGAGVSAGFLDANYVDKGARIAGCRTQVFAGADADARQFERYLVQRIYPTRPDAVEVKLFSRGGNALAGRVRTWHMRAA